MARRLTVALLIVLGTAIVPVTSATAVGSGWPHTVVNGFSTPSGKGYWLVYQDGSVAPAGDARFYGDASRLALAGPIVGGAVTPDGRGYWLVAMDGGIFTYGSARFFGSMGGTHLNQPVFSMAPTATGRGYWLVARDGGMFSFGDAKFHGSMGGTKLNQPINGITRSGSGHGYRMVARDGGIFSFGDVRFYGSLVQRGVRAADVVGMAASPTNKGYWIARADGSVYPFGDALHYSSAHASPYDPVQAIFANPKAKGYRLVTLSGAISSYGTGGSVGSPPPPTTTTTTTVPSNGSTNCSSSPHTCGFPDATNTGIMSGATLTQVPSQATSGSGWACSPSASNCHVVNINGDVGSPTRGIQLADGVTAVVTSGATGATVMNLKVTGAHGEGVEGVAVYANNVEISHCELQGAPPSAAPSSPLRADNGIWVASTPRTGGLTVDHCNIHGFAGGVDHQLQAGAEVTTNNFIHDMQCWDYTHNVDCRTSQAQWGSAYTDHDNNVATTGGPSGQSSWLIQHNTFWMDAVCCTTATISMFNDFGAQDNVHGVIDDNLLSGGAYCVDPGYGGSGSFANHHTYIRMTNNHFSQKYGSNCSDSGISYVSPLNASKGAGDYQCANMWDDGPRAGSGADASNYYPTSKVAVTSCPSPPPW